MIGVRILAVWSALFLTAATVHAPDTDGPKRDFAVRCGRLYVAPGRTVDNCWLVVRDGKIAGIVSDANPPEGLPVIDASGKVVMPGIVAADTDLSGHRDDAYNVTPDFVALDGFDFMREYRRPLSGGVTTAYLAPGRNRLVPGQGSVVKLFGDDIVERVLAEDACLRVTLGEPATQAPPVFEPTISPTADDPLEPARRQFPSSRLAQLTTLRALFREAMAAPAGALIGTGAAETRYDPAPLARAARGELALRVAAREATDIRRALQLGAELGQPIVLEDPWDIGPIAGQAANGDAAAIFRVPVLLGASNPGGEDRRDDSTTSKPENAGLAANAGMAVALAPARDSDLGDYLLVAGVAVRYGLEPDAAIAAVTSTAARILGVAERVGTLEPGKDADFLVLSGEPLAVGTLVEQTWIDGVLAFEREEENELLAVKAGHILTGDTAGNVRDGVVVIANGRIRAVGAQLAAPFGARVIDLGPDAVITPGFLDAFCAVGLSGDGTGVPAGEPDHMVAWSIDPQDPAFAEVRRAGITTVLASGRDGALVSGRVAAVKTGARDRNSMIVDHTAAQRFVFDAVDPKGVGALKQQIERGKKYREAWAKYEKALADWEAGEGEEPEEAPAAPDAEETDPVSGVWTCKVLGIPLPVDITVTLELTLKDGNVTGRAVVEIPSPGPGKLPPADVTGTFEGDELALDITLLGDTGRIEATVKDDHLEGTITGGPQDAQIEGTRTEKGAAAAAAASAKTKEEDGPPKKPKVDQKLEPIRELLDGEATAVIRCGRAPAILAVMELMRAEKIRFALHGANDAIATPEILGEEPPAVVLGTDVVKRDHGKIVNAAAQLADAGVPVALSTGDVLGSRYLPLHAAHAIRYGLDPQSALRALTSVPAQAFGIDDRVGSLARGKDADLVVFSGNPFEVTSRVLLVVCNGHVVHDGRSKEDPR